MGVAITGILLLGGGARSTLWAAMRADVSGLPVWVPTVHDTSPIGAENGAIDGMSSTVDVLVIGGGINGAAVARDAAGRGLSVCLAERGDYACATSAASSKLIHGRLRYLEHFEFRLVRESLREREVMLRIAPHLVSPLRFLLPDTAAGPRSLWTLRTGLWLYDRLSGRRLIAPAGRLGAAELCGLAHLKRDGLRAVLHYPDCQVDDARLVLETLLDARRRGADIGNHREVVSVNPLEHGRVRSIACRFLVNTAGPWANDVLARMLHETARRRLRLVRGSHDAASWFVRNAA